MTELSPEFRQFLMEARQHKLGEIDAMEKLLGIPRTSEARKYAKDNGWITGPNITYTLDVSEVQPE